MCFPGVVFSTNWRRDPPPALVLSRYSLSLYCNTFFLPVLWNQTRNISKYTSNLIWKQLDNINFMYVRNFYSPRIYFKSFKQSELTSRRLFTEHKINTVCSLCARYYESFYLFLQQNLLTGLAAKACLLRGWGLILFTWWWVFYSASWEVVWHHGKTMAFKIKQKSCLFVCLFVSILSFLFLKPGAGYTHICFIFLYSLFIYYVCVFVFFYYY